MTKKGHHFFTAPGDTNVSDAIGLNWINR